MAKKAHERERQRGKNVAKMATRLAARVKDYENTVRTLSRSSSVKGYRKPGSQKK